MTTKPNPTPWSLCGGRYQSTLRAPLVDGEVWPLPGGRWAYEVVEAVDQRVVERASLDSFESAKDRVRAVMADLALGRSLGGKP